MNENTLGFCFSGLRIIILMPRFMNGVEKSTTRSLSEVIVMSAIAMSALCKHHTQCIDLTWGADSRWWAVPQWWVGLVLWVRGWARSGGWARGGGWACGGGWARGGGWVARWTCSGGWAVMSRSWYWRALWGLKGPVGVEGACRGWRACGKWCGEVSEMQLFV